MTLSDLVEGTYQRPHHQRIAKVLEALDATTLATCRCAFGGGTAIALAHGEYRVSLDVDFEVSNTEGYRRLRKLMRDAGDISPLVRPGATLLMTKPLKVDQYGIRTFVSPEGGEDIKFEIISEGRIDLDVEATQTLCGVPTLSALDLVATKLLANADRWADRTTHRRDLLDIAMMRPSADLLAKAATKAGRAYPTIVRDLRNAIAAVREDPSVLDVASERMKITLPRAVLVSRILDLEKRARDLEDEDGATP